MPPTRKVIMIGLVNVLDALIKFMHRDENWSIPELEENDYEWAHALLIELVDAVGENDYPSFTPLNGICLATH